MDSYRLSPKALAGLNRIRRRLEREAGKRVALRVESAIFEAFDELVRLPQIGHKRSELRRSRYLYYNVFEYVIVFRREPRVVILDVVHGARNLPAIL